VWIQSTKPDKRKKSKQKIYKKYTDSPALSSGTGEERSTHPMRMLCMDMIGGAKPVK